MARIMNRIDDVATAPLSVKVVAVRSRKTVKTYIRENQAKASSIL